MIRNNLGKNKNTLKVSVIMANYNKAKYLPESIESVLYQTYENFELIIDDYSEKCTL